MESGLDAVDPRLREGMTDPDLLRPPEHDTRLLFPVTERYVMDPDARRRREVRAHLVEEVPRGCEPTVGVPRFGHRISSSRGQDREHILSKTRRRAPKELHHGPARASGSRRCRASGGAEGTQV